MDLPQIGPPETVETPKAPSPVNNDSQPFTAQPYAPLIGFLELGNDIDNKTQTDLQEIWDYLGKETGSETTVERLYALRVLESRLSPPRLGQSRLNKVHSYIQAQQIVENAEKWRNGHLKKIEDEQ